MKERKNYEVPSIMVISMDDQNDIIQTSSEYTKKLTNIKNAKTTQVIDAEDLFN